MSRGRPIRVLIADDHAETRDAMRALLHTDPNIHVVATAGTVASALELVGRERPDVVLLDIKLAGNVWPQAAEEIRRISPDSRIVAFSASDDQIAVLEALAARALEHLVKGVRIDEIRDSIYRCAAEGGGLTLAAGAPAAPAAQEKRA